MAQKHSKDFFIVFWKWKLKNWLLQSFLRKEAKDMTAALFKWTNTSVQFKLDTKENLARPLWKFQPIVDTPVIQNHIRLSLLIHPSRNVPSPPSDPAVITHAVSPDKSPWRLCLEKISYPLMITCVYFTAKVEQLLSSRPNRHRPHSCYVRFAAAAALG